MESVGAAVLSGYQSIEMSWILENNEMMNRIVQNAAQSYGVYVYRTYRMYQMPIAEET
jgi:hypothetical protein